MDAQENSKVHFDCRVEPSNDPSLRVDWFFNGRPFATGSRVHTVNDFGYVSMDIDYVYARDSGEYICRASNKWGTATTKAKLICKGNILLFPNIYEIKIEYVCKCNSMVFFCFLSSKT